MRGGPRLRTPFFVDKMDPSRATCQPGQRGRRDPWVCDPAHHHTPLHSLEKCAHNLTEMAVPVKYSHHEAAQGQHEIDLQYTDALTMADNVITAKLAITPKSLAETMTAIGTLLIAVLSFYGVFHRHLMLPSSMDQAPEFVAGWPCLSPKPTIKSTTGLFIVAILS